MVSIKKVSRKLYMQIWSKYAWALYFEAKKLPTAKSTVSIQPIFELLNTGTFVLSVGVTAGIYSKSTVN